MDSVSRQLLMSGLRSPAKLITFNGASGAGTDYQVLLKVGESSGASGSDFWITTSSFPTATSLGDVAFVSTSGQTYPAWVEQVTGTAPNRVAWIWVKVLADLSASQSFYIRYNFGYPVQTPNGNDVFILFDDFSGTTLDTGKWVYQQGSGATVSGGVVTKTGTNSYTTLRSVSLFGDHTELVGRKRPSNTSLGYVARWGFGDSSNALIFENHWENSGNSRIQATVSGSTATSLLSSRYSGTYYRMRLRRSGGAASVLINDTSVWSAASNVTTANMSVHPFRVYDNGQVEEIDWLGVKKYRVTEPSLASVGSAVFI